MRQIELLNFYRNAVIAVPAGLYALHDERLAGFGNYLVENGFAVDVTPVLPPPVVDEPTPDTPVKQTPRKKG